jgi:hypothetical protein
LIIVELLCCFEQQQQKEQIPPKKKSKKEIKTNTTPLKQNVCQHHKYYRGTQLNDFKTTKQFNNYQLF